MKTVLYLRVSTEKQEVDNQRKQLIAYADNCRYQIIGEYVDIISGKEESRPGFDKLFEDAHKRAFNLVLFWDISRFSRSGTLFTLQKLKELENLNIYWESYQEQYFRSIGPFRDAVISILATLAKMERERISQKTKAGLATSKNKHLIGKRGKDKKPRKVRKDRGIIRGINKSYTENDNIDYK